MTLPADENVPESPDRPVVRFLVVGTPRSGTTLVQRLACEIPGVGMPPETNLLSNFGRDLARRDFPLDAAVLRETLEAFAATEARLGADFDVDDVLGDLAGGARSVLDVFDAVARRLAGPATILGEKTPLHLAWWRPLTRARPDLRIIAVLREPRAVVSSNLANRWASADWATLWGDHRHLLFAEKWRQDERTVSAMAKALGPERALVLRYEDVVVAPDRARQQISRLLGTLEETTSAGDLVNTFVLPWEIWKQQALGPITSQRATGWQADGRLSGTEADQVAGLCWSGMRRRGYPAPAPLTGAAALARIGVMEHRRLRGQRALGRRERAAMDAIRL